MTMGINVPQSPRAPPNSLKLNLAENLFRVECGSISSLGISELFPIIIVLNEK